METRLSHDPLLDMLGRDRALLDTLRADMTRMKEETGTKNSLVSQLNKLEVTQAQHRKELQQHLYKLQEFADTIYARQMEAETKADMTAVQIRGRIEQVQQGVDGLGKEARVMLDTVNGHWEQLLNVAEGVCALVELEAVASALEQQDEVDRKNFYPEGGPSLETGYKASLVSFLGHPFKR